MEDEVARLDARAKRVKTAILVVALATIGYLLLVIAVLSQVRTPLPWWAIPMFLGLIPLGLAIPVLRSWHAHLVVSATQAHIAETRRILDEIDDELARSSDPD